MAMEDPMRTTPPAEREAPVWQDVVLDLAANGTLPNERTLEMLLDRLERRDDEVRR